MYVVRGTRLELVARHPLAGRTELTETAGADAEFSTRSRDTAFRVAGNRFTAAGWAFDQRNESLLKSVTVMLDDQPLPQTRYRAMRKDVAEVFEIPAPAASG